MADQERNRELELYQLLQQIHDATTDSDWECEQHGERPVKPIDHIRILACNGKIMAALEEIVKLTGLPSFTY